ncbi:hypothetical protein BDR06DRAFT_969222 [Suillus hirtellus]|nr:hypothetical protein BDR06DRAFT_969222 [Suillus hirtellus]
MGYNNDYQDPKDHMDMKFENLQNKGKAKEVQVFDKANISPAIQHTPAFGLQPPIPNVLTTLVIQPCPISKPRPIPYKMHNAPSTSDYNNSSQPKVTVYASFNQNDKDPNIEFKASANDQIHSSSPTIVIVAQADQSNTPIQAKVVSTDPNVMTGHGSRLQLKITSFTLIPSSQAQKAAFSLRTMEVYLILLAFVGII